ncbi:J domain-containing protein required for chloroplast accumulation response 1-like [Impatiens glandulifera]|uniref:J domain-containing protein required for chloroplast accumulation response 1-like n=1 Tax=Impatiens glandulifera TaxID=253017 RepID=UPI001FB16101|nr:J domain-containing protein required for chloroplast accumulation response 1-like [Impatiens glandulifera]
MYGGGELNSDIDYGDVFGGPPKRSSMNVIRHSFAETVASNASTEDDEEKTEEKPVFGHEASNRQKRHNTSDDFYDDIFRGDGIYSSSSPWSLPAKLTKLESTGSSSSPGDFQTSDEIRSRVRPAYRPSPLSYGKEELPDPVGISTGDESKSKENSSMFHFSLYKWAGKGSPLHVSLRGATNGSKLPWKPKSKDNDSKQIDKDSSSSSSTHIVADEEKQDYQTSSKTISEESSSEPNLQKKTQKPSKSKNSMPLQSFLDESDNIAAGRFEGKNRQRDGERTKTESSGGENVIRNTVKGKIKGFAKIFDSSKSQNNIQVRSQSLRWDRTPKSQPDNAARTAEAEKPDGKLQGANMNKAKIQPDSSKLDNKNDKVSKEQKTDDSEKILPLTTSQSSSTQTDENKKPPESVKETSHDDLDDNLGDYFQVKELFVDNDDKDLENTEKLDNDNNQVLDTKIRQWAQGKEGNIRSLLSTLQLVLWPNSGWKPVALVDIIEGNAVKRSYQKTLLYLHPDKLQQRGAPPDHHYIARKVFDLLQEAWDHFNTVGQI